MKSEIVIELKQIDREDETGSIKTEIDGYDIRFPSVKQGKIYLKKLMECAHSIKKGTQNAS